jgi:alkanesulfonate monooxygenase SsuD/methylene tetrahydromethanopterin reductase-like flavin-dependent oxidoreductase (luciferase family)
MDVGHLVLANPYRHPGLLAKMATTMDHATRGHFILGLGAGWHEIEAAAYGLRFGPVPERLSDLEAAIRVILALLRDPAASSWPESEAEAATAGGVTLDAPPYSLQHARSDPPPFRPKGPPLWLGVQGERVGLRLVAQYADGWNFSSGSLDDFTRKREALLRHCEAIGRDPAEISVSAQVQIPEVARWSVAFEEARKLARLGCDHIVLYMEAREGPEALELLAKRVAQPLKELAS